MGDVLLMTASIIVDKRMPYHLHISENERLRQYLDALIFYITKSNFSDIIFIDGSGYNLNNFSYLIEFSRFYNKNLELLSFNNDQNIVVSKGKGYGENKILEFAINNSKILKTKEKFFKVTGRYIVKNINKILLNELDKENCFFKGYYGKFFCNTAFFKVNKKFFLNYLFGAGEPVNDKKGIYLEHIYLKILKEHKKEISSFRELPIISGVGGGGGVLNENLVYLFVREFLNKIGIWKI